MMESKGSLNKVCVCRDQSVKINIFTAFVEYLFLFNGSSVTVFLSCFFLFR